jgi:alpha-galactosidase
MMLKDLMECPIFAGSQVVLVDINAEKLKPMADLAQRMNAWTGAGFEITSTTERTEALPGADFVIVAVEQQRYRLWSQDYEIPAKHGVRHAMAEVAGPGGMFHTFRQVPIVLDIAHDMEALCPDAWFINMSNPESRLIFALERYSQIKSVGVCLGAYITRHALAKRFLGLEDDQVDIKVGGLNHCHWVMEARHAQTGEDLYPEIRRRAQDLDPDWQPLSVDCLRRFGYFPGPGDSHVAEFLRWGWEYYRDYDWVAAFARSDERSKEFSAEVARMAEGQGSLSPEELQALMGEGGLPWQTIDIIRSLVDDGNRYVLSLNIPNDGYISNVRQGAVVEVSAIVGADRIYGLRVGELPPGIAALTDLQLRIMELVVDAAVTGDRQAALEALYIDPVMPNPQTAQAILDEMLLAQAEFLPQFG